MFSSLLTYFGVPFLVRLLSGSLRDVDHPAAKGAAQALDDVDDALKAGQISPETVRAANSHMQKMAELEAAHLETAMKEINTSLRAEIASEDKYVRRMRPTFGYLMALTWAAQMFGLAYVIIFKTGQADAVINAMASLGTIWTIGLSVLGIYVYKRSEDKKAGLPISKGPSFLNKTFEKLHSSTKDTETDSNKNSEHDRFNS